MRRTLGTALERLVGLWPTVQSKDREAKIRIDYWHNLQDIIWLSFSTEEISEIVTPVKKTIAVVLIFAITACSEIEIPDDTDQIRKIASNEAPAETGLEITDMRREIVCSERAFCDVLYRYSILLTKDAPEVWSGLFKHHAETMVKSGKNGQEITEGFVTRGLFLFPDINPADVEERRANYPDTDKVVDYINDNFVEGDVVMVATVISEGNYRHIGLNDSKKSGDKISREINVTYKKLGNEWIPGRMPMGSSSLLHSTEDSMK